MDTNSTPAPPGTDGALFPALLYVVRNYRRAILRTAPVVSAAVALVVTIYPSWGQPGRAPAAMVVRPLFSEEAQFTSLNAMPSSTLDALLMWQRMIAVSSTQA